MDDYVLTRDLILTGYSTSEIRRMVRQGDLTRLRRGAYITDEMASAALDPYDLRTPHRRLIEATLDQLHPRAVISHGSAATVLGLPLFRPMVTTVHVTRDRRGGGVQRPLLWVHGSPLSDDQRMLVDGLVVTSLARTAIDVARTVSYDQAVAVADQALRGGVDPAELAACLGLAQRQHGCGQARRAVAFADGRSESVGESFSRVRICDLGLPVPTLQHEVFDDDGYLIGRGDFAWPERRTLGEFDGKVKYGKLLRPGQTASQAVYEEKLREDALRDHGWQIARWDWDDLFTPQVIRDRIVRAFARSGHPYQG